MLEIALAYAMGITGTVIIILTVKVIILTLAAAFTTGFIAGIVLLTIGMAAYNDANDIANSYPPRKKDRN